MLTHRVDKADDFGHVAVLMGGTAAEREVSLKSGAAVLAALQQQGVHATGIDVRGDLVDRVREGDYDRVFNVIHGRGGEDGVLQATLESLGVPYTGSGVLASALAMDKLRTKLCWIGAGIPTPAWRAIKTDDDITRCAIELGFPLIVKPSSEGSSIGMSRAGDPDELRSAWEEASRFRCAVFAEQWVDGSEYTASILGDLALPLIRLETPNVFYDFDAKYRASTTRYHCPSGLDAATESRIQALALEACAVIGVTGWGRVDLLIDQHGQPWLIEVNTVPGMTDHSLVPMAAQAAGIGFEKLVWRILETSFSADAQNGSAT